MAAQQAEEAALSKIEEPPKGMLIDPQELVDIADGAEAAGRVQALEGNWIVTRKMEGLLCWVHDTSGMPWWIVVILATTFFRICTSPLFIMQIKNQYKILKVRPEMNQLLEEYKAKAARGEADRTWYSTNQQAIFRKHGINHFQNFAPAFVNAPVFMSFFFTLRTLGESYLPSLQNEGIFWFKDLTVPDPYLGLPVLASLSLLFLIEFGSPDGNVALRANQFTAMRWFIRSFALFSMLAVWEMPAVVPLYWVFTNMFQLTFVFALRQEKVRQIFGIYSKEQIRKTYDDLDKMPKQESPQQLMREMYDMMNKKPKEIEEAAQKQKFKYTPDQLLDYNPKQRKKGIRRGKMAMGPT